jgi:lipopolysaccharide/colanic/teichoic acid biosynthesis glycosyltransferase
MSQSGFEWNATSTIHSSWETPVHDVAAEIESGDTSLRKVRAGRRFSERLHLAVSCPRWKRAMDLVGAVLGLVIFAPLFLVVAAWIRCVSRGPVFFRQRRFGAGGRRFILWKFRTMAISEACQRHRSHVSDLMEHNLPLKKRDYELAIIHGGKVLRKLGLDELPQFINVLRGEMSLVGPRPDVVPMRNYKMWQQRRFEVVPGITGLWQVCGKNDTTFDTMMLMDILYVRRRSFWYDVIILLRTIPAIVRS